MGACVLSMPMVMYYQYVVRVVNVPLILSDMRADCHVTSLPRLLQLSPGHHRTV